MTSPATPTIPATEFPNGADFLLSWDSNGAYYEIYRKSISKPVYQDVSCFYTVAGGITTDTTFILVATSGEDVLYEPLTITVSNPDITPKSIVATGNASFGGNAGVVGNASIGGDLSVEGKAGVAGDVNIGGNAEIAATLAVAGKTTLAGAALGDTSVSGTLSVGGAANLPAISEFNGNLGH